MSIVKRIVRALTLILIMLIMGTDTTVSSLRFTDYTKNLHLVVDVIDGDTILLENSESVRYIGVDAPETMHPSKGRECYGQEATQRNEEFVEGKYVYLEIDQTNRDVYDRLLRYVFIGDIFVNAELISEGYAYSSYFPPDIKYYDLLLEAELEAEEQRLGLWSVCR